MMDDSLKIQATLRLRNARMIEARERLGMSQKALSEDSDVPLHNVGEFEALKYSKIPKVHEKARRISMSLGIPVDHILPPKMAGSSIDSTIVKNIDVDPGKMIESETVKRLMLPSPEDVLEEEEMREEIRKVVSKLNFQQRNVLTLRYGLDGKGTHSVTEAAEKMNVTVERARQVELAAIRKLRYLVKGTDLEIDFIEEEGES
jgi:RNA polymerase sigma factor (sigma-70 family)